MIDLLERAVTEAGHTLLPRSWMVQRGRALTAPLEPKCAIDEDVIEINRTWLTEGLGRSEDRERRARVQTPALRNCARDDWFGDQKTCRW